MECVHRVIKWQSVWSVLALRLCAVGLHHHQHCPPQAPPPRPPFSVMDWVIAQECSPKTLKDQLPLMAALQKRQQKDCRVIAPNILYLELESKFESIAIKTEYFIFIHDIFACASSGCTPKCSLKRCHWQTTFLFLKNPWCFRSRTLVHW